MSDSDFPLPVESTSLRAYFRVLRDDVVAKLSGSIGVILAFAAAYFEWISKNPKTVLWVGAALAFFVASYRLWTIERQRYLSLYRKRLIEINTYREAALTIDHRPGESVFIQDSEPVKQYRVSVRSLKDVSNVELVVNHLKIKDYPTFHNLHLRPMHDRDVERGTKRVKLHARKENYWDLVTEFTGRAMESGRAVVQLNCIPALGKFDLPAGYYEFELLATGDSAPEATKIVNLAVGDEGVALFQIKDGSLNALSAQPDLLAPAE